MELSAEDWIAEALARIGAQRAGESPAPRVRPWGLVQEIPTSHGRLFFKEVPAGLRYEVLLTQALQAWTPGRTPIVVAAEAARGWMLLEDGGETLRERTLADGTMRLWEQTLTQFAEMQVALVGQVDTIAGFGAMDMRTKRLPLVLESLLANTDILLLDQPEGLTGEQHSRLMTLLPRYADACRELEQMGMPTALFNNDMHDANVFVQGDHVTIADWSDSGIAHPLLSAHISLRSAAAMQAKIGDASGLDRLQDAFCEPWTSFASRSELKRGLELVERIGPAARAHVWHSILAVSPPESRAEFADAVPGWLQILLEVWQ